MSRWWSMSMLKHRRCSKCREVRAGREFPTGGSVCIICVPRPTSPLRGRGLRRDVITVKLENGGTVQVPAVRDRSGLAVGAVRGGQQEARRLMREAFSAGLARLNGAGGSSSAATTEGRGGKARKPEDSGVTA